MRTFSAYRFWLYILVQVIGGLYCLEAQAHREEIAKLRNRLNDPVSQQEKAHIYARLGMMYTVRNLDSCYHFSTAALSLADSIKDDNSRANALNVMGFYYMEKGKTYLAYKFVKQSLELFRKLDIAEKVCEGTMNLGVLLGMEGKADQSLRKLEEALEQSATLINDSIRAIVLINIGVNKLGRAPFSEMEPLFEEAIAISTRHRDDRTLISAKMTYEYARLENGANPLSVREAQKELARQSKNNGYEYLAARVYFDVGYTFAYAMPDSTAYYFDRAIRFARETGYQGLEYYMLERAYDTFRRIQPESPKVSEYGSALLELARSVSTSGENGGVDFLELVIKETELEARKVQYQLRHTWMWGGFLTALLSILGATLIYRQYRMKRQLVSDLQKTNAELSRTNDRLGQNDDFHRKLISILSHDLRQPFAALQMFSDELMTALSEDDLRLLGQEMKQSATISLQVMDGLLHWMKLHTVGNGSEFTSVSVRESMLHAIQFHETAYRKRGVRIDLQIPDSRYVQAQSEILLFVNRNIIHNAIKFSPEGGVITISAELESGQHPSESAKQHLVVRIADAGPGLSDAVKNQLFQKHRTWAEKRPTAGSKGAGLALIICHEMLLKMNGTIWADNNPGHRGASFYYRLPVA